jgi:hypothetical protein
MAAKMAYLWAVMKAALMAGCSAVSMVESWADQTAEL